MTSKNFILCLIGFLSAFVTVQVEGYNFRSANRSMASVENQRYIKSDKKDFSQDRQSIKDKVVHELATKGPSVQRYKSSVDNRGLMPHEKSGLRRNLNFKRSSGVSISEKIDNHQISGSGYSDKLSQPLDQNWRHQGSFASGQDQISKNFRPKGNNLDLLVAPYKGEFYSRGGKPFSIDPGLLGRWK